MTKSLQENTVYATKQNQQSHILLLSLAFTVSV